MVVEIVVHIRPCSRVYWRFHGCGDDNAGKIGVVKIMKGSMNGCRNRTTYLAMFKGVLEVPWVWR
jgi:hypothetical protein